MLLEVMKLLQTMLLLPLLLVTIQLVLMRVLVPMKRKDVEVEGLEAGEIIGVVEGVKEEEDKSRRRKTKLKT